MGVPKTKMASGFVPYTKRDKKFGGDLKYKSYSQLEKDFKSKKLHPLDLKMAVADEINDLLKGFRKESKKLEKLSNEAYS